MQCLQESTLIIWCTSIKSWLLAKLSYLMLLQIYADLMVMGVSIPPFRSQGKLFQTLDEDWRKSVEIPHSSKNVSAKSYFNQFQCNLLRKRHIAKLQSRQKCKNLNHTSTAPLLKVVFLSTETLSLPENRLTIVNCIYFLTFKTTLSNTKSLVQNEVHNLLKAK
jgi:hypothetical protein